MDASVESGEVNDGLEVNAARSRRNLLKAAVGTGVAVAVYSAPKVSVVPAYGLATSMRKDGKCYAFGWSSNNPTGKGWMDLSSQPSTANNFVVGPNKKETQTCGGTTWVNSASDHSGTAKCGTPCTAAAPFKGPVRYTWTINKFGSLGSGTFDLVLTLEGSVNGGDTVTFSASGLPSGYCLKWYNSGQSSTTAPVSNTACGYSTGLLGNSAKVSGINSGTISNLNASASCSTTTISPGKIYWHFDVRPCGD